MEVVNLLDFLNSTKDIHTLEYASCEHELVNFLDLITEDEQFIQKIDLGVVYINSNTLEQVIVVDGLSRLLSLSLLLHAICECYKKTSPKNDNAIATIRKKYLLDNDKSKLKLPAKAQVIYNKILFGEKLSGKEKESAMFKLLHNFWSQIKEESLQASNLLKTLQKVYIAIVEVEKITPRDLFYTLNKDKREINQLALISDYMKSIGLEKYWDDFTTIFSSESDITLFFKDFFITKFNFKKYSNNRLYEVYVNYFETMLKYMSEDILISKIINSAKLYFKLLNVDINDEQLKKALIKIKMNNGEDTYAYLLNIYEDYVDDRISHATFLEILNTINEYLQKRSKTPNNIEFNELINYLNAFITCK